MFHLLPHQQDQIDQYLDRLYGETRAQYVLLAKTNGELISQRGCFEGNQAAVLSTLSAAQLALSSEIAGSIQQQGMGGVLQEGQTHSIYLNTVAEQLTLLLVFPNAMPLGIVRVITRQTIRRIKRVVHEATPIEINIIDQDFIDELLMRMNRVLV